MASDLARRRLVPESFRRGYENGGALKNMAAHSKNWRRTRHMIPRPESGSTPNPAPRPQSVLPAKQAVSKLPLSLWERVGVREPRGKQAGANGNG